MQPKNATTAILLITLGVVLVVSVMAPGIIEAGAEHEYKFVRLLDEGGMPSISEALNREADAGWKLTQMAVDGGDPGAIYLVFEK